MNDLMRDTWLEVDLKQLRKNVEALKDTLGNGVQIYAVLKANAYGCGLEAMGRALIELGIPLLAVATLSEALILRSVHKTWPVLVMGPTPIRLMGEALRRDIQLTLVQPEEVSALEALARNEQLVAKVQIKVDTGLRRVGFSFEEAAFHEIRRIFASQWLSVTGVFSHLALVNWETDQLQLSRFLAVRGRLESAGLSGGVPFHISDSISGIAYPDFRLDAVRIGAALYGMKSYRYEAFPIEQITRFMSRVAQLKTIETGEGVGYDFEWVAKSPSVIATLPFGYADGYPRELKGKGYVVIHGSPCPVVGVVCMDQCMVDVTELAEKGSVKVGDDAIVYGPGADGEQTISEISSLIDTNKNDILTRVTERVPRVYNPL